MLPVFILVEFKIKKTLKSKSRFFALDRYLRQVRIGNRFIGFVAIESKWITGLCGATYIT